MLRSSRVKTIVTLSLLPPPHCRSRLLDAQASFCHEQACHPADRSVKSQPELEQVIEAASALRQDQGLRRDVESQTKHASQEGRGEDDSAFVSRMQR
jgi:hypothetical protein